MTATNSIDDCQVQILICIDEEDIQEGTDKGIYLLDNQLGSRGAHAALPTVGTVASRSDRIYWRICMLSPSSYATAEIVSIGNSKAWGFSGQPESAFDSDSAFTGQVQEAGTYSYNISITVTNSDQGDFSLTFTHTLQINNS
ncbi:hypothetical protein [Yersinia sp. Marseille-Q3913]|uniref:hypothetical protein n=1 Tax=Yersinia sp. Marseille-Q3913 TaxID=2830769 RepID=UPI001BAF2C2C|nr:hypothetical protein [Yersinia sp. Marseille-Q3913]MBS0057669.1 hypothetical protein [Yersinia sp. Marseille-Q3913]